MKYRFKHGESVKDIPEENMVSEAISNDCNGLLSSPQYTIDSILVVLDAIIKHLSPRQRARIADDLGLEPITRQMREEDEYSDC